MSHEEAVRVKSERGQGSSGDGKNSYKFSIGKNQWLYMLSTGHTMDPEHPGIKHLRTLVPEFLERTNERRIVMTEGGIYGHLSSLEESVKRYGESGAVMWLAKDAQYLLESPEPNEYQEMKAMLDVHSLKDTMAYYIIRQHNQWARGDRDNYPSFDEYSARYIERYRRLLPAGMHDNPYTYQEILDLCDHATRGEFSLDERIPSNEASDPSRNPVAATCTDIRDNHILRRILYAKSIGLSILLVYGSHHAIRLEPALRSLESRDDN